ncbi:MAG: hypothetical protein IJY28_03500 [Clostridia bacterium]|nr:hypothetical protein [Clostridia bacterium]
MARRNYFEILGLPFDPAESNKSRIDAAITAWEQGVQKSMGQTGANKALQGELALKADMVTVMGTAATRNKEANDLKKARVTQLEQLLDILQLGEKGTLEVTEAQIRSVGLKLGLQPQTVRPVYQKKNFVIQKPVRKLSLNDITISKTIMDELESNLVKLRTMPFTDMPWTGMVNDLFDFACFYSGGQKSDLAAFRRRKTADLCAIMETGAVKKATDLSEQGHVLQNLFSKGKAQIFNSEDNRKKYEQTLEKKKLDDFFRLLKQAPEIFKKDPYFAENCIRTIQKYFPDYDTALALYNYEAGLMQDPYEPLNAMIRVTCGSCRTPMEFRTRQDAEKATCASCGAALYITCPACKKKAPAGADRCSCGFQISEMLFFDDYCRAAQTALDSLDITEARRQMENAKLAHPGHPDLKKLEDEIARVAGIVDVVLKKLNQLMSARKYVAAQKELNSIREKHPQLNLTNQTNTITTALKKVEARMPVAGLAADVRAARCVEILNEVADYQPALDLLRTLPLRAPKELTAGVQTSGTLSCELSWKPSGDSDVTYRVVRKMGTAPQNASDGTVLAENLSELRYKDTTMQPAITYCYAVFACRCDIYSPAATCTAEHFSELDGTLVQAMVKDGVCHLSWVLPSKNCLGVRVIRQDGIIPTPDLVGGAKVVAACATAGFEDRNVINGQRYGYRLQCVYDYNGTRKYSKGWTCSLMPDVPPVSVANVSASVNGTNVTVSWSNKDRNERTVEIRSADGTDIGRVKGQVQPADEINRKLVRGKVYATARSTDGKCSFQIPQDTAVSLAVITRAATQAIVSEVLTVSSLAKCEIDRANTQVLNNRLIIQLKTVPSQLENVYYMVNCKKKPTDPPPFAGEQDARSGRMQMMSAKEYMDAGMIVVDRPPQEELYVTIIGQYRSGNTVSFAPPSNHRVYNVPPQEIKYNMVWGTRRRKKRDVRLVIETVGGAPDLKLVYRTDGRIPHVLTAPGVTVLHTIPRSDEYPGNRYEYCFPDEVWSSIPKGTELRLMLVGEDDPKFYKLIEMKTADLKVP